MTWHQLIIVGNLGRDPELRYMQDGTAVCNFNVAVNERKRDRQSGEWGDETTWYRVAVWGRQAETCNQYLSRGRRVLVSGSLDARLYTNNAGETALSLDVRARDVRFLSGRGEEGSGPDGGGQAPPRRRGSYEDFAPPPSDVGEIPF